ncbi:MAG: bifunctional 4-hydroxy-2-oxoglutarate aldolase/2-dehydro-3-deoxy-phosphogluconate aldolase [Chloroflexi bacterium]|nr:bifunctional 4-hydroxy-2-oxoglutarate aldolase/2-dehydro-3-deoxy-phosphogluconate aldolase [Chloroflexota bacterium]
MPDIADTLKIIEDCGLVAVIRAGSAEQAVHIALAVAAGGVLPIEITMTVPGAIDVIRQAAKKLPGDILLGAGTVLDVSTAVMAIRAGAEFIVSPSLEPDILKVCRKMGKVAIPGVFTPTEIVAAIRAGADIIKLFPASIGGPDLIKDLRGPFPELKLMPTGGVTLENAGDFIRAGAAAVAVGGNLVNKQALAQGDYATITETARKFTAAILEARRLTPGLNLTAQTDQAGNSG